MVSKTSKELVRSLRQNMGLTGLKRADFVKSAWEDPETDKASTPYALFRTVYALYFIAITSATIYHWHDIFTESYLIYATNWTLIIQTIYGTLFASRTYIPIYKERQEIHNLENKDIEATDVVPKEMSVIDSVIWFCLSILQTAPLFISIGFWVAVYDPSKHKTDAILPALTTHGFNALFALIDLFVMAIPIRLGHCVYALTYAIVYLTFTGIYEACGGFYGDASRPYIYPPLNWRETPGTAILSSFTVLIVVSVLHVIVWVLYHLRLRLVPMCRSRFSSSSVREKNPSL